MGLSKIKVLKEVEDKVINYGCQDHNNILHFLKHGNPSQHYLEQICNLAEVTFEKAQEEQVNNVNSIPECTAEAYKNFGGSYKGD